MAQKSSSEESRKDREQSWQQTQHCHQHLQQKRELWLKKKSSKSAEKRIVARRAAFKYKQPCISLWYSS